MNIVICDDEIQIASLLQKKLQEYAMRHSLTFSITLYSEGRKLINSFAHAGLKADLIFLDIKMKDMDGISVAEELRKMNVESEIIFLSGYKEYVFDSFRVRTFRYLLKPLKEQELWEAMDALLRNYNEEDRLEYDFMDEHYSIRYKDIVYIEGMRGKIWIHCGKDVYRWRGALSNLHDVMKDKGFFLIHRSYLINMSKIVRYNSNEIIMEGEEAVPLSKYKRDEFKKEYIRLWRDSI
ncbi:MAG: LytTR family DNA-binding domain-containing protein [Lachnospiraceae bacterium]|nr:LytTR family DNA-binding domain-containing protein [Lachnospiraceae bacterium]